MLDGFSKTYAMTGWRLGYAIVDRARMAGDGLRQAHHQQHHRRDDLRPVRRRGGADRAPGRGGRDEVAEFRARRDLIVDGLNAIPGVRCLRPYGAFDVFPDIAATGLTGAELAERLLLEVGVSVLAGTAFGGLGTQHIRLSYANSREKISAALERMRTVIEPLVAANA